MIEIFGQAVSNHRSNSNNDSFSFICLKSRKKLGTIFGCYNR